MSRELRPYAVYGFASTHDALDAEKLLEECGIDVVPIPAPPAVSASCGIALRVPVASADEAERFLLEAGIATLSQVRMDDY